MNTYDLEEGTDGLSSTDTLKDWLVENALLDPSDFVRSDDHRWALTVREALRELLIANTGEPADPAALPTLNVVATMARFVVVFDPSGHATLIPEAAGVNGALGGVLASAFQAMADGTWPRLKACRNPGCQRAFFDRSKNKSAMWCSMNLCGNREKARRFRQKRRIPKEVPLETGSGGIGGR